MHADTMSVLAPSRGLYRKAILINYGPVLLEYSVFVGLISRHQKDDTMICHEYQSGKRSAIRRIEFNGRRILP
jgi:hypothetical protein